METNKQQDVTLLTAAKQQDAAEAYQLVKAVKCIISKEIQKLESSITSAVQDKVEQLWVEVQQDIKAIQHTLQGNLDHVNTNLQQCETQIDKCHTYVTELQSDFYVYNKKSVEPQMKKPTAEIPSTTLPISQSTKTVSTPLPTPMVKSDHIK